MSVNILERLNKQFFSTIFNGSLFSHTCSKWTRAAKKNVYWMENKIGTDDSPTRSGSVQLRNMCHFQYHVSCHRSSFTFVLSYKSANPIENIYLWINWIFYFDWILQIESLQSWQRHKSCDIVCTPIARFVRVKKVFVAQNKWFEQEKFRLIRIDTQLTLFGSSWSWKRFVVESK